MIFPCSEGGFSGARTFDGNICIGDTSLSKYMPKNIKPMSNSSKITCGYKTCISAMLLKSDLNNREYHNDPNLISFILILRQLHF